MNNPNPRADGVPETGRFVEMSPRVVNVFLTELARYQPVQNDTRINAPGITVGSFLPRQSSEAAQ